MAPDLGFMERVADDGTVVFQKLYSTPWRYRDPSYGAFSQGGHISAATNRRVVHTIATNRPGEHDQTRYVESLDENGKTLWRSAWAPGEPLLAAGQDGAAYAAGLAPDPRRFPPHVVWESFDGWEAGVVELAKFDTQGKRAWTQSLRQLGTGNRGGHVTIFDMAVGTGDRLWVLGTFMGALPLRPDLTLEGLRDGDDLLFTLFMARFSASGEIEWGEVIGQAPANDPYTVTQQLAPTREGDIVASLFYGDPKDWPAPALGRDGRRHRSVEGGESARCSVRRYHAP